MTLDEVIAHVEIKQSLATYFRALDRREPELLKSVYHPDSTDNHGEGIFSGNGHEFCDWILSASVDLKMARQHHLTNVYIELDGENFANVECYGIVVRTVLEPDTQREVRQIAGARLLDRFERRDGKWKVLHRQVVVDWVGKSIPAEDFENPEALKPFPNGQFYPDDISYALFDKWRGTGR